MKTTPIGSINTGKEKSIQRQGLSTVFQTKQERTPTIPHIETLKRSQTKEHGNP